MANQSLLRFVSLHFEAKSVCPRVLVASLAMRSRTGRGQRQSKKVVAVEATEEKHLPPCSLECTPVANANAVYSHARQSVAGNSLEIFVSMI